MKHTFDKYIKAANGEQVQKIVDELRKQALKDNPELTAEQWQILKCFCLAGAIAKLEKN